MSSRVSRLLRALRVASVFALVASSTGCELVARFDESRLDARVDGTASETGSVEGGSDTSADAIDAARTDVNVSDTPLPIDVPAGDTSALDAADASIADASIADASIADANTTDTAASDAGAADAQPDAPHDAAADTSPSDVLVDAAPATGG